MAAVGAEVQPCLAEDLIANPEAGYTSPDGNDFARESGADQIIAGPREAKKKTGELWRTRPHHRIGSGHCRSADADQDLTGPVDRHRARDRGKGFRAAVSLHAPCFQGCRRHVILLSIGLIMLIYWFNIVPRTNLNQPHWFKNDPPMMDWKSLPAFLAVARQGSLRAAAQQLGGTHATLRRQIEALEARLGVLLFRRGADGFHLTAAGRTLLPQALEAEAALLQGFNAVQGLDREATGRIRLSADPMTAHFLLAPVLANFLKLYPRDRNRASPVVRDRFH